MWLFLNDAFLSIVQPAPREGGRGHLLVRARFRGDIERVFPEAQVTETPVRDYRFRALIRRQEVQQAIADEVRGIGYENFKGSVGESWRHDAYLKVWGIMEGEQRRRAGPRQNPRQPRLGFADDAPRTVVRRRKAV